MEPRAQIIDNLEAAEALAPEWDRLAVALSAPYAAPAWGLSWWRNAAPADARLRVVAVRDGGELVGLGPFWAAGGSSSAAAYQLLGGGLAAPLAPLVAGGREDEVTRAMAVALAGAHPRVASISLEDDVTHAWRVRLRTAWPGRAWSLAIADRPLAVVDMKNGYDDWFASRSSKFRQRARRGARRLEEAGATLERAGSGDVEAALEDFERLHSSRWEAHGGSNALVDGWRGMFRDIASELIASKRLRLYVTRVEGKAVSVWIMLAAGRELAAWNTGFDESWSDLSPAFYAMLPIIEEAAGRGETLVSFGSGVTDLKHRLADRWEAGSRDVVVPVGPSYVATRLRLAPAQVRGFARRHLSAERKDTLRRLVRR